MQILDQTRGKSFASTGISPLWLWLLAASLASVIILFLDAFLRRSLPLTIETMDEEVFQWRFWAGLVPLVLLQIVCTAAYRDPVSRAAERKLSRQRGLRPTAALKRGGESAGDGNAMPSTILSLLALALDLSIAIYFGRYAFRRFVESQDLLVGGPGPAIVVVPVLLGVHALCAALALVWCLPGQRAAPMRTASQLPPGRSLTVRAGAILGSTGLRTLLVSALVALLIGVSVEAAGDAWELLVPIALAWIALVAVSRRLGSPIAP